MSLKTLFPDPSPKIPKWLVFVILGLGLLGLADASYLTANHYFGVPVNCIIGEGCDTVLRSAYSEILGVPVALLGALYYLAILILAVAYIDTEKPVILKLWASVTPLGFLFSLWFVAAQLFIIRSICVYCMFSALTSTLLFLTGIFIFYLFRDTKRSETAV